MHKLIRLIKRKAQPHHPSEERLPATACVIPREQHNISRSLISEHALKVLYRLKNSGYSAYLVGGGVRDLLLGREPKDFDVVTNARPEEIRRCFRNCVLIGKRFRLVHVVFKNEIIEVSTFRATHATQVEADHTRGMVLEDNVYGSFSEDTERRDFTINALYYNIADFSVIDCHNGLADLKQGILRIIGNPALRYREDPVRLLRAARIAAKLGFRIDEQSERYIFEHGHLLTQVSPARLLTELEKLFLSGMALNSFKILRHYRLFKYLLPATEYCLNHGDYEYSNHFISLALEGTDLRITENKYINPGFLFAVMLWYPLLHRLNSFKDQQFHGTNLAMAINEVMHEQSSHIALPRRYTMVIRDIWLLQERFKKRHRTKVFNTLNHPRFRAGYDFLVLRAQSGESVQELSQWWHEFYIGDNNRREQLLKELQKTEPKKKKRRRKRPRKKTSPSPSDTSS